MKARDFDFNIDINISIDITNRLALLVNPEDGKYYVNVTLLPL